MRITEVLAIPIAVPTSPFTSTLGTFDHYEYGVVQIRTDSGAIGLGEISTLWDGAAYVQCAFVERVFGPRLVGRDPFAVNHCLRLMDTVAESAWPARAAIDMALFDIVGKVLETPVYNLLGGKVRDRIQLSRSISMGSPLRMAEDAQRFVADGFGCVKVKVGVDAATDLAAVAAVRQSIGPQVALRVDANMGWSSPKEAIRMIRMMEEYDLHSVEQPIPPGHVDAMREIRWRVEVPVMADESVWGPADAWNLLTAGAADILNVYVSESGGLTNSSLIFRMAETAGVSCVIGCMPELGIGTAAAVHLGMAMTNLGDFSDASGVLYQSHDVINERFLVEDGYITAPSGPGLGVTLDEEAVERYRMR